MQKQPQTLCDEWLWLHANKTLFIKTSGRAGFDLQADPCLAQGFSTWGSFASQGIFDNVWLPLCLSSKESTCNARAAGDMGLILGSGRSPAGGHSNPLQYSCLENPMDRRAWWATVQGRKESEATEATWHASPETFLVVTVVGWGWSAFDF